MKKVLTIAAICALSVAFTGCGKDETVNNNTEGTNNPIVNVENTASPLPSMEPEKLPEELPGVKPTETTKPVETVKPSEKPVESVKPSVSPSTKPVETVKPSESPVITPEPTVEPSVEPTVSPEAPNVSLEEIVEAINNSGKVETGMLGNMPIDAESASYFIGLTEDEFNTYVEEALANEPMMSSIAHSLCIVKLKDASKVEEVKQKIFDNCNPRKWLCVSPEYILVVDSGDYVAFAMTTESNCKGILEAFKAKMGTVGTTLERTNID